MVHSGNFWDGALAALNAAKSSENTEALMLSSD
jgi:hypothetical protein